MTFMRALSPSRTVVEILFPVSEDRVALSGDGARISATTNVRSSAMEHLCRSRFCVPSSICIKIAACSYEAARRDIYERGSIMLQKKCSDYDDGSWDHQKYGKRFQAIADKQRERGLIYRALFSRSEKDTRGNFKSSRVEIPYRDS